MDSGKERVVILGASNKVQRYSNKAQKALAAAGHTVIPVNPAFEEITELFVFRQDYHAL